MTATAAQATHTDDLMWLDYILLRLQGFKILAFLASALFLMLLVQPSAIGCSRHFTVDEYESLVS